MFGRDNYSEVKHHSVIHSETSPFSKKKKEEINQTKGEREEEEKCADWLLSFLSVVPGYGGCVHHTDAVSRRWDGLCFWEPGLRTGEGGDGLVSCPLISLLTSLSLSLSHPALIPFSPSASVLPARRPCACHLCVNILGLLCVTPSSLSLSLSLSLFLLFSVSYSLPSLFPSLFSFCLSLTVFLSHSLFLFLSP